MNAPIPPAEDDGPFHNLVQVIRSYGDLDQARLEQIKALKRLAIVGALVAFLAGLAIGAYLGHQHDDRPGFRLLASI